MPEVTDCFLAATGKTTGLREAVDLLTTEVAAGVVGGLRLADSKAGKSSDCKADCEACEAIVFESPLLEASCCTSCFACESGISGVELGGGRDGVAGIETLESGVAART
jgi:hypothetical protein